MQNTWAGAWWSVHAGNSCLPLLLFFFIVVATVPRPCPLGSYPLAEGSHKQKDIHL